MYDATIGRWNSIDPNSEKYYEKTVYNYASNNPVSKFDPDGKDDYFSIYTGRFLYSDGALSGYIRMIKPIDYYNFINYFLSNKGFWNEDVISAFFQMKDNSIIPDEAFFYDNRLAANNILKYYYEEAGYDLSNSTVQKDYVDYGMADCGYEDGEYIIRVAGANMGTKLFNRWDYINLFVHERGGHGNQHYNASLGLYPPWETATPEERLMWEKDATRPQLEHYSWPLTSPSYKQSIYNASSEFFPKSNMEYFWQYGIITTTQDYIFP